MRLANLSFSVFLYSSCLSVVDLILPANFYLSFIRHLIIQSWKPASSSRTYFFFSIRHTPVTPPKRPTLFCSCRLFSFLRRSNRMAAGDPESAQIFVAQSKQAQLWDTLVVLSITHACCLGVCNIDYVFCGKLTISILSLFFVLYYLHRLYPSQAKKTRQDEKKSVSAQACLEASRITLGHLFQIPFLIPSEHWRTEWLFPALSYSTGIYEQVELF